MTRRIRISVAAVAVGLVLAISCTAWAGGQARAETKTVYYRPDLKIIVDGRQATLDVTPFIIDPGWIMVPAEFISKELGASVAWDDASSAFTITTKGTTTATAPPPQTPGPGTTSPPVQKDIKGLVAQVSGSVVLITTYDLSGQGRAQGSGVVVGKDMIITNLHVITGASRVVVTDAAGKQYPCPGILGVDLVNDLALLKCETGLSPVGLGDSDKVAIGDQVVAIGNPKGLQGTVSDGIVSGVRDFDGRRYIQTTAPVSPGSSGGGLFAMDCTLVGITTLMVRDAQNLNMAVPANLVKGMVSRPGILTAFPGESSQPTSTSTSIVTYTWPNGDTYVGQVKDGKMHGLGTYRWAASGDRYVGQWEYGVRQGQGTFFWAKGDAYVGQFEQGESAGQGIYTWANGNKYEGQFENGRRNGFGTFTWPNGDKYSGQWKDSLEHGLGTYTWANGDKFVGEHKDGMASGLGVYQWANGHVEGDVWVNGKRIPTGGP
jgi:hypothetical protein